MTNVNRHNTASAHKAHKDAMHQDNLQVKVAEQTLNMLFAGTMQQKSARDSIMSLLRLACNQQLDLTSTIYDHLDLNHKVIHKPKLGLNQCKIGMHFFNCILVDASFRHSKLSSVIFIKSILTAAKFHDAYLQGAKFDEATLNGTFFIRADLTDASFREADVANADFTDAICSPKQFIFAKNIDLAKFSDDLQKDEYFKNAIKELQRNQTAFGLVKSSVYNLASEYNLIGLFIAEVLEPAGQVAKTFIASVRELLAKTVNNPASKNIDSAAETKLVDMQPEYLSDIRNDQFIGHSQDKPAGYWTGVVRPAAQAKRSEVANNSNEIAG